MKCLLASLLCSAAFAAASFFPPVSHADDKPLDKGDIETIVKKVISDHPELIIQSLQNYEIRKRAEDILKAEQSLKSSENDLKNNPDSPVAGNPKGDVTIVEFFDYHCGYCKKFFSTLSQLIEEDKNIKVVFKEYPILSEDSELAAKAALAVNSLDKSKYLGFHTALMKMSGAFTLNNLTAKAQEAGIDKDAFTKAMQSPAIEKELDNNRKLAKSLNINGTPGIIIGDEIAPGAIPLEDLKAKVASARMNKK